MKLDVAVNETVLSNVGTTGEFRIRNSAKAFKILSDGLYSNKIRAIIRELSCNAVDSHVAAGKADVPFEVHLPTILEPWFSVRDFGTGLDGNQVENIYTTYFESTKTNSNDFIGALGLGSKSPFSYTENFTVTAIKDGVQRIYSAFINEAGVPSIAAMGESPTTEGNGVEVKFSVIERYDYQSFISEAYKVFMWFKVKPKITGVANFEHKNFEYKEKNIVPGVHVGESRYGAGSFALMGNIAYPLDNIPDVEKNFKELADLLRCNLVLEFDIGELDFAASREQLSYIPLTLNSIRRKLEALNANLAVHLAAKANAIENEWERAYFLYEESQSRLYKAAVTKYVTDTKFALYDIGNYYGKKDFAYKVDNLAKRGITVSAFRIRHGSSSKISEHTEYVNGNYIKSVRIPVEKDVVIVFNDLKTGCLARARYHFNRLRDHKVVFCFSHSDPDLAVRQAEYDAIVKELHNPPVVIKASELSKPEPKPRMASQGILEIALKNDAQPGYAESYKWVPYTDELDEDETYHFVYLVGYDTTDAGGASIEVFAIKAMMDSCGIKEFENIKIFGVRKSRAKEIAALDNWVWFEDALRVVTAGISDKHIASLVAAELLDGYYTKVYTNTNVAKMVGPDSDYAKYVKEYANLPRASGKVTELVTLCSKYGKSLQVDAVRKKINDAKANLYHKYPLLKHLSSAEEKDVAHYIKMVDKQEKT